MSSIGPDAGGGSRARHWTPATTRGVALNFDLGLQGLALLVIPALVFGLVAQLILWRSATHWLWLVGAVAWFVGGLFASEVLFGSETTEESLQPLIDGLLWDEALLGGFLTGVVAVLATWLVTRQRRRVGVG